MDSVEIVVTLSAEEARVVQGGGMLRITEIKVRDAVNEALSPSTFPGEAPALIAGQMEIEDAGAPA